MFKKPSKIDSIEENQLQSIVTKVGNQWKINSIPITEQQLSQLSNEAKVLKTSLLYRILTETQVREIEQSIIADAKTMEELNFYRAMLADRIKIKELLDNIINSSNVNTLRDKLKY